MSMPACAAMNEAMQTVSSVHYQSSEQHKESTEARQKRDHKDVTKIREFFKERSPIPKDDTNLRNIVSGVDADETVKADKAKEVGQRIIANLQNKIVTEFTFKRSNQIVTMSTKSNVKVDGDVIDVDPQLLFQRFTTAARNIFDDPSEIFRYELCSVPSALFENNGLLREAQKSSLADYIWNLGGCGTSRSEFGRNIRYVIDGGWQLHRILWPKDSSYASICSSYVDFVKKRYGKATIVFDSYPNEPTTKDVAHLRRNRGTTCQGIAFCEDMVCKMKKYVLLSNKENKQRFIDLLGAKLKETGCLVLNARDDADIMIVQTALSISKEEDVVLIGKDTDLLVLLCHHEDMKNKSIFFTTEPKQQIQQTPKIWDIKRTKEVLGKLSVVSFWLSMRLVGVIQRLAYLE
ncbi:hypothetical protein FSP39_007130 [Pinctada imbricata]|uniref:Uncharacterized protein n=1 Tax=Pinctada imbricata TaxID=66713 RepID=A0AA88YFX3_PINIB|nr:hypothetical protein FSP39_007130 [Pinctada imbricata]